MKYSPVIGLEIHIQLNTKSKMFCGCSANVFTAKPNSHTCPVCLGLPGALPVPNAEAIKKAQILGLALNCSVNKHSKFDRKNYFYPDLPKGYQISQYDQPLSINGFIDITGKKVGVRRVHLEEDTGKSMHIGSETLLDFNKSGIPLAEIVTDPDMCSAQEASELCQKINAICKQIGVSNADMEKGNMRLEANISLRPQGSTDLPSYRVEIKNINSFKFLRDAITYEIERQSKELDQGKSLIQETRGWNAAKKISFSQRKKEFENDYRYFPEPDIPPMEFSETYIENLRHNLPKLPEQLVLDLVSKYQISTADATILCKNTDLLNLFHKLVELGLSAKVASNLLINRKDLRNETPEEIVENYNSSSQNQISNKDELSKIIDQVITENPTSVQSYKNGKLNALQYLIGQVMKKTQGRANAGLVSEILKKLL